MVPIINNFFVKFWLIRFQFLFYWRFNRLLGFFDGVEAPEDLKTCFLGKYTIQGFWKELHRSMYLWLLQYLYLPMGGNNNQARNVFLVFGFFILTHNISLDFLKWGLFTAILIVIERFTTNLHLFRNLEETRVYGKYLKAMLISIYLALVQCLNMAVFIMGSRAWTFFGGFFTGFESCIFKVFYFIHNTLKKVFWR